MKVWAFNVLNFFIKLKKKEKKEKKIGQVSYKNLPMQARELFAWMNY